jgi:hypothetical protein
MEVRVDDWGVDACYSGTHKCLSIPSGGSPITFGERAMRKVRNRQQKPYSYYFDIQELMRYWSGGMEKSYHHTAAIPLVYATHEDPQQRHYLNLYKLGPGPLYSFYTPYHLCHFEVPLSAARAVLFGDSVLAPAGAPVVDVVATAKRALRAGEVLDRIGGYCTYGLAENATARRSLRFTPMQLVGM